MRIGLRQSPENSVFSASSGVPGMGADPDGDPLWRSEGPALGSAVSLDATVAGRTGLGF